MATSNKIVHLHLNDPVDGKQDYYFGSLAAIYDLFSSEQLGITYGSLTTRSIGNGGLYTNKRCSIRVDFLHRKKQQVTNI